MKKSKKLKSVRISTTLPQVMVEDFKDKAAISGVSVSRLIYLQLKTRNRNTVVIVSGELLQEVQALRKLLKKIITVGNVEPEALDVLRRQVQIQEKLVDLNCGGNIYVS